MSFAKIAEQLSEYDTPSQYLNLSNFKCQKANTLVKTLDYNTSITSFSVGGNFNAISPLLINSLKINSSLQILNLSSSVISDTQIKELYNGLKNNSNLVSLNMSHTRLGNSGAKILSQLLITNSSIRTLEFWGSNISFEGATNLAYALIINSSLTSLNLSNNCIGNTGASEIANTISTNSSLRSLDLAMNGIDNVGMITFATGITRNEGLTYLNLGFNTLSPPVGRLLRHAQKCNSKLHKLELPPTSSKRPLSSSGQTLFNSQSKVPKNDKTINFFVPGNN